MSIVWRLLFFTALASAQVDSPPAAGPDPVENFCMRWSSQTAVKNDVLYIDSGVQRFQDSDGYYLGNINYMITVPLTDDWDWKATSGQSRFLNITTERTNVTNTKTGAMIPNLMRGYMFHGPENSTDLYRFGGTTYMANQSFVGKYWPADSSWPLWTYSPGSSDQKWDQYSVGQSWTPNHGAGTDATDHGLGFYLNGQIDMGTSQKTASNDPSLSDKTQDQKLYTPLDGMLVLDLVSLEPKSANISTSKMKGNLPRVGGALEYIPSIGNNGILVALGGQIQPSPGTNNVANKTQGELIDFESVDIFDIDSWFKNTTSSGTWYQQNTTGDIPPPRIDFCTVSISAPDNSSHHIYMYGGYDPTQNDKAYDDVVVLTLPSFRWTTAWPNGGSPRRSHNCHVVGKRQMITVGGNQTTAKCDWEEKGVAIFDLSGFSWGSVYLSKLAAFQVPKQLFSVTGGNANGSAAVGTPALGWTDDKLREVFWQSRWTVPTTWASQTSNGLNGTTGTNGDVRTKRKSNTAAIAGGAIGGVATLLLVSGVAYIWYRKKRRRPAELHSDHVPLHPELDNSKDKHELQGINENDPAELPSLPAGGEMDGRAAVEADHNTTAWAAELSSTNVAPGATAGVPMIRTPGDDLPEMPEYTPGLRRPSRTRRRSRERAREQGQKPSDDNFQTPTGGLPRRSPAPWESEEAFVTPAEEAPPTRATHTFRSVPGRG